MAKRRRKHEKRRRAGSARRDAEHRSGGDWSTIRIPEGVDIFKPKEKVYRLDIVPYEVKDNPYADPGGWYYERTFFIHRNVGPDGKSVVCPGKTAGKKCPICEERARVARDPDGDTDLLKELRPKERQLFLVRDRDEEEGIKLFEFSNFCFGELLDERRRDADDDEGYVSEFDDPDAGAVLRVKFKEVSAEGFSFIKATSIEFKPRKDGLPEELLDHGICLDDLLIVPEYDELKKLFFQIEDEGNEAGDGAEEDRDETPESRKEEEEDRNETSEPEVKRRKKKVVSAEDKGLEEGMEVEYDGMDCEIVRISRDGTSLVLEDEDGNMIKAVGADEVVPLGRKKTASKPDEEKEKEEGEEPEPRSGSGKDKDDVPFEEPKSKSKSKPKDDDDEDWDSEDDDWD